MRWDDRGAAAAVYAAAAFAFGGAFAAEICDVNLTPQQVHTATFENGVEIHNFNNLKVTCQEIYKKGDETVRAALPIYYRQCNSGDTNEWDHSNKKYYDPEYDTCVQFQCPQPEMHEHNFRENSVSFSRNGDMSKWPMYAGNVTEMLESVGGKDANNEKIKAAGQKANGEFRHPFHDWEKPKSHYHWEWPDNRYKVEMAMVEWCNPRHDWTNGVDSTDYTTCECGIRELVRAKDPSDRHEWDYPPWDHNTQTQIDSMENYDLDRYRNIQFPAARVVPAECQGDSKTVWNAVYPEVAEKNDPDAIMGMKSYVVDANDWMNHNARDDATQSEDIEGAEQTDSWRDDNCAYLAKDRYSQRTVEWCQAVVKGEHREDFTLDHNFVRSHHQYRDLMRDSAAITMSPSGGSWRANDGCE
jgi:hypothetical protein